MTHETQRKIYPGLILLNILVWLAAFIIYHQYPISLSLCLLAYGFGLRHGLDADHVAAIDSATRKLIDHPHPQNGIGFFFSLGHSTIVFVLAVLVALTAASVSHYFPRLNQMGNFLGGYFSVCFLLLFSAINFIIFKNVLRKIKRHKQNENGRHTVHVKTAGFLTKIFQPMLKLVNKAWHMYFIGLFFGLGFDTATEVALLGISAYSVSQHISVWAIMIFPALFTAGMCLVDTTSGMLILRACQWAYINPLRKLYYNLSITLFSFLTALIIAAYEFIYLFAMKFNLTQGFWLSLNAINNHFELMGLMMIIVLLATWFFSARFYKFHSERN